MLLRKIINLSENRDRILMKLHDEEDYRDKERIYKKIINKY